MNDLLHHPRSDRLYDLLPAIYRMRDADQGYPLRALLAVVAEQVNLVEDDILQLWNNWFVETAEAWAVPYIGDLIGYRPVLDAGEAGSQPTEQGRALLRVLTPRREVANTIRYRRRKGTLALLEQLASDIAGWPARPVEFFKLLAWTQNLNHLHLHRARTAELRNANVLDLLDGPFDRTAHTVDVRRINSHRTIGRYNIPSVGVFVWRLRSYSVTRSPANCSEADGPHCFTFSVLGQDTPLFAKPRARTRPTAIPGELSLPTPIRRRGFDEHPSRWYGPSRSFAIWADGWAGFDPDVPIPVSAIIPADLTGWRYVPPHRHIAVDPVLGRFAFPPNQLPRKGVRVTYHYGFPADIGGGEYDRPISDPSPHPAGPDGKPPPKPSLYRVGRGQTLTRIGDALAKWRTDNPEDAVIELTDSGVYVEPVQIALSAGQTLQIRAANRVRPVIRLLDWQTDLPDSMTIAMGAGSRFTLDGLLVTGRAVQVTGPQNNDNGEPGDGEGKPDGSPPPICSSQLVIRHCTLVPGWGIDCDCEPMRPAEPSLELSGVRSKVRIEHSIVGSIQVTEERLHTDPIPLTITDSIVDATGPEKEAIGAPGAGIAHVLLTMARCTVFGIVDVHAMALGCNSIFNDCVHVARRQIGCMRFCYVPPGCRTPRRYHCQPDLVVQAVKDRGLDPAAQDREIAAETLRVRPQFVDTRYGRPAYAQLALTGAAEIKEGADDESEMGVYHDLFEPQRRANLEARLDEYTPAGMDVGLIFAT
ncbi:MAG TPA: hypothetical protein VII47_11190 [Actinomycetota bacterium]